LTGIEKAVFTWIWFNFGTKCRNFRKKKAPKKEDDLFVTVTKISLYKQYGNFPDYVWLLIWQYSGEIVLTCFTGSLNLTCIPWREKLRYPKVAGYQTSSNAIIVLWCFCEVGCNLKVALVKLEHQLGWQSPIKLHS
jgi:hypothetical protein